MTTGVVLASYPHTGYVGPSRTDECIEYEDDQEKSNIVSFDSNSIRILEGMTGWLYEATKPLVASSKQAFIVGPVVVKTEQIIDAGALIVMNRIAKYPSLHRQVQRAIHYGVRMGSGFDKKLSNKLMQLFLTIAENQGSEQAAFVKLQLAARAGHQSWSQDSHRLAEACSKIQSLETTKASMLRTIARLQRERNELDGEYQALLAAGLATPVESEEGQPGALPLEGQPEGQPEGVCGSNDKDLGLASLRNQLAQLLEDALMERAQETERVQALERTTASIRSEAQSDHTSHQLERAQLVLQCQSTTIKLDESEKKVSDLQHRLRTLQSGESSKIVQLEVELEANKSRLLEMISQLKRTTEQKVGLLKEVERLGHYEQRCQETEQAVLSLYKQRKKLQQANRELQEKVIEVENFLTSGDNADNDKTVAEIESTLAKANLESARLRELLDDKEEDLQELKDENAAFREAQARPSFSQRLMGR